MKMAVVGSRRRHDKENVHKLVDTFDLNDIVISGGCTGVDTYAVNHALSRGIDVVVIEPDLPGTSAPYHEHVKRYHLRNKKIAKQCDIMFAFVAPDRKGGTENAIQWAKKFGKPVVIL
jgi:predicted Rossmann-fold nucleotide-binding protein